jgi:hypothetical protein
VEQELTERGFSAESIGKLDPVFTMQGTFARKSNACAASSKPLPWAGKD